MSVHVRNIPNAKHLHVHVSQSHNLLASHALSQMMKGNLSEEASNYVFGTILAEIKTSEIHNQFRK